MPHYLPPALSWKMIVFLPKGASTERIIKADNLKEALEKIISVYAPIAESLDPNATRISVLASRRRSMEMKTVEITKDSEGWHLPLSIFN